MSLPIEEGGRKFAIDIVVAFEMEDAPDDLARPAASVIGVRGYINIQMLEELEEAFNNTEHNRPADPNEPNCYFFRARRGHDSIGANGGWAGEGDWRFEPIDVDWAAVNGEDGG